MCAVVVCRYERTETPFEVENMGIRLYSMEELAYFIYENISLVDRKFLNNRLFDWISEEIGDRALAARLKRGSESGTDTTNLVYTIMKAVDMYSPEEMELLADKMRRLTTYQEQERLKLRADEYFANGNYRAASTEYQKILDIRQSEKLGTEFYAHVWNNLGVCYCRMFLFYRASSAFRNAYKFQKDQETLEAYILCLHLSLSEKDFKEAMNLQRIKEDTYRPVIEREKKLKEESAQFYPADEDPEEALIRLQREYLKNMK